jgi:hypothetical protein
LHMFAVRAHSCQRIGARVHSVACLAKGHLVYGTLAHFTYRTCTRALHTLACNCVHVDVCVQAKPCWYNRNCRQSPVFVNDSDSTSNLPAAKTRMPVTGVPAVASERTDSLTYACEAVTPVRACLRRV